MAFNLTLIFVGLLLTMTLTKIWLGSRQISYVMAHRAKVPEAFAQDISLEAHQKAADYSTEKNKLNLIDTVVEAPTVARLDNWRWLAVYRPYLARFIAQSRHHSWRLSYLQRHVS